jgi:hypothetical protein
MNKKLASRINKMAEVDQQMRTRVQAGGEWDLSIDKTNTEELKSIIDEFGWPTIDLVGEEASNNAWLLAQHADHDLEFQKEVLDLLIERRGENPNSIRASNIAYLTDRILVAEGKEQEFGTQFKIGDDGLTLRPVRDFKNVNERRFEYGLDEIERYIEDAKSYIPPKK